MAKATRNLARLSLFAAATVVMMQPARADGFSLASLFAPLNEASVNAAPLSDHTLVFDLKTGTIRNTKGEVILNHIISGEEFNGVNARNDSHFETRQKFGPLPAGTYRVEMRVVSPPPNWVKEKGKMVNHGGIDRPVMHIEPINGTDTHGRGSFEIHPILTEKYGETGTFGCVGTRSTDDFERLAKFRASGQFLTLRVDSSFTPTTPSMTVAEAKKASDAVIPSKPVVAAAIAPTPATTSQPAAVAQAPVAPIRSTSSSDDGTFASRWAPVTQL